MADAQVVAIIKSLEQFSERLIKKITLDIAANLRQTTPVQTGWARANWVPSVTRPKLEDLTAQSGADRAQYVAGATTKAELGDTSVLAYRLAQGSIFITNNVPYIVDLNQGSSRKAPAGFVQGAIEKAITQDIKNL